MANNDKQWSSAHPGLLVILLDQSGSMLNPYIDGESKTVYASKAVNKVIDNIIQSNFDGESPKNRCFISVIGYNNNVKEIRSGWLKDLDDNPLRVDKMKQKQPDGTGGLVEVEIEQPIWVEPISQDGATNMKGAFELAKELVTKWMNDHQDKDAPAPVIINISDGVPYYDGKDPRICMEETKDVARSIMQLGNEDGNVLIFNAMIDSVGAKNIFPNDPSTLGGIEEKFLFDISSEIPASYVEAASKRDLHPKKGSRGCIYQADGVQLVQLIDFGSSKGQGDRGL